MCCELAMVIFPNAVPGAYGLIEILRRQQEDQHQAKAAEDGVDPVRKFRTEKAAQRYLDDNAQFFAKITFQIEHIQNGGNAI